MILALAIGIASPLPAREISLRDVCSLYIDELGRESGADIIREKIRVRLEKSGRFRIVPGPSTADAVLTGVAAIEPYTYSYEGTGGTKFRGGGLFRLVDRAQQTIWSFEYPRERGFRNPFRDRSASDRVADKTVEQLLNDAGAACSRSADAEPPDREQPHDQGSPAELKGLRTCCVLTDDQAATSALVLTLRDLLPDATFTDSPTDCRTSQAIFFYNTKAGWGDVFIRSRVLVNGQPGVRLDVLVKNFIEAWRTANAVPAGH
jgi:hypothetical protein